MDEERILAFWHQHLGEYLKDEIEEIMKYKWCLGVEMKRDPLETWSMNQICQEWIQKYGASYRRHWCESRLASRLSLNSEN